MKSLQKQQKPESNISSSKRFLEILKFGIFGAIGFGVGGLSQWFWEEFYNIPLFNTPTLGYINSDYILTLISFGAIGGLVLGLAIKDWKKARILALAGAVGFISGFFVGVLVVDYVIGSPPTEWAVLGKVLYDFMKILILWAVIGAIVGASLGYVFFKEWKQVLIMALAGGIGYLIGNFSSIVFLPLLMSSDITMINTFLMLVFEGAIGGLFLGLALGWLETGKKYSKKTQ